MIVKVESAVLTNVWQESFKDRNTGEIIEFYRALVTCVGEPPMQLAVSSADYENLKACVGTFGSAEIDIDAQPGRRVRVRLLAIE